MNQSFWHGKRVLVTGHTGFKGSWLTFWLKSLGAEICGYALEPETEPNLFENLALESEIESVIADIRDLGKFQRAVENFRPEIIFHLAAQSLVRRSYRQPVETYTTNVIGTINVLEAARQADFVRSIVIVTTDKVYENKEWDQAHGENERLGGFDPYSNSKACAELAVSSYRNSFFADGETLIATARAGNVIGGGDWSEDRLLPDVFRSLIFGEPLEIRNPHSIRPWQHTIEPLAGYIILAERLYNGERDLAEAWNFGPGKEDSRPVDWVLKEIRENWTAPFDWTITAGKQLHETKVLMLDSTKARNKLKWLPKLTLSEAIALTTDWYLGFKNKSNLIELTKNQIKFYNDRNADNSA